jgi:hypothetical protein
MSLAKVKLLCGHLVVYEVRPEQAHDPIRHGYQVAHEVGGHWYVAGGYDPVLPQMEAYLHALPLTQQRFNLKVA